MFKNPEVFRLFSRTGLGLALGVALSASCNLNPVSVFTCLEDQNCIDEAGEGAICEPNNLCTVPDVDCPAGKRWHDRAADLAGKCYEESDLGGTGGTGGSGSGSGSTGGSGGGSTDSGPVTATTMPADSSDDGSTTDPPPMTTDDGGSTSTGSMGTTCDEIFGMAPGYELCEETADTCSFNAMTNGGTCDDMCMMFNSVCVTAFTNDMSDCASQMLEVPCTEVANDNICVCAK